MSSFLDTFFFYDSLPGVFKFLGESFGFDTACLCSYPNFFNLALHFIIAAIIIIAITKPKVSDKHFLSILLIGILFSGFSKFVDWTQNILTATGETVFWNNNLDVAVEVLQLIGIALIVWGLLTKLKKTTWV